MATGAASCAIAACLHHLTAVPPLPSFCRVCGFPEPSPGARPAAPLVCRRRAQARLFVRLLTFAVFVLINVQCMRGRQLASVSACAFIFTVFKAAHMQHQHGCADATGRMQCEAQHAGTQLFRRRGRCRNVRSMCLHSQHGATVSDERAQGGGAGVRRCAAAATAAHKGGQISGWGNQSTRRANAFRMSLCCLATAQFFAQLVHVQQHVTVLIPFKIKLQQLALQRRHRRANAGIPLNGVRKLLHQLLQHKIT